MKQQNKKMVSNQLRLQSLQERKAIKERSKQILQLAFNNVDSERKPNHHIKFDSDEDDCEPSQVPNGKMHTDVLGFENEEDSDDIIKLKPQFAGKSGQKLLELQSRVGMDERFKIDERFAVSDDEHEPVDDEVESMTLTDEKQRNLKILQQVIGPAANSKLLKRKSVYFHDPNKRRYDPSNPEHAQFEVKPQKAEEEKKSKKKKSKEPPVPTDERRFYEASQTNLKAAFGTKATKETLDQEKEDTTAETAEPNEQPFSFLKMFGRDRDDNDTSNEMQTDIDDYHRSVEHREKLGAVSRLGKKKVFTHDSSDSDDQSSEEDLEKTEADGKNRKETKIRDSHTTKEEDKPRTFFFQSLNDPRITEGPRLFCWNRSKERIRREWSERKDALIADYKKKHRDAVRQLKRDRYRDEEV